MIMKAGDNEFAAAVFSGIDGGGFRTGAHARRYDGRMIRREAMDNAVHVVLERSARPSQSGASSSGRSGLPAGACD